MSEFVKKRNLRGPDNEAMFPHEFGKLPPQARSFEEMVLGAVMIEKEAITDIPFLTAEMFYVDAHQRIFSAILDLHKAENPVDIETVVRQLLKNEDIEKVGGAYYVIQLTNKIGTAANIEYHARIIQECYMFRHMIAACSQVQKLCYEDSADLDEAIEKLREAYESTITSISSNTDRTLLDIMTASAEKIFEEAKNKGMNSHPVYLSDVDMNLNIEKGDLVIIAARPGMGKTAFALDMVRKKAKAKGPEDAKKLGTPCGFVSLETNSVGLGKRLISQEGDVDIKEFKIGEGKDLELKKLILNTAYKVAESPLYISEDMGMTLPEAINKIKKWVLKNGVTEVVIDYLQLIDIGGKPSNNREQDVSKISRSLKLLASKLNIVIYALSQLSRPKGTTVSRPVLTDLRESGAIEQDADAVIFLHRPEYYNIDVDENNLSTKGMCEVIIGKQRSGPLTTQRVRFIGKHTKFRDFDKDEFDNKEWDTEKKKQKQLFEEEHKENKDDSMPF